MHGSVIPQLPYTQHFYAKLVVEGLLGFPLESWWHEHVLLHHLHTKTEVDPDENIHQGVPIWRLTNATSWSKLHSFPVTSHALVGLLHPHLRCFAVESWRLQQSDSSVRAGYALVVIAVLLLHWLPLFVQKNKRKALLSIFLSSMLASMMTMFAFHVNHLFPEAEGGHDQLSDWGERQLITTTNFYSGFNAVSGGLDLQIEHHLFPMLSYNYQQAVQATIKEVAEEFNLPYRSYTSLGSGLIEHFAYMVELGCGNGAIYLEAVEGNVRPCARGACRLCGFCPTEAQAKLLTEQEAHVEECIQEWDRKVNNAAAYLSEDTASRLEKNMEGLFADSHWLRDRVARHLVSFYEGLGAAEEALALATRCVDFTAEVYPGFSALHAWSLETQGDLKLRVAGFGVGPDHVEASGAVDVNVCREVGNIYGAAADALRALFGADHEFYVAIRDKRDALREIGASGLDSPKDVTNRARPEETW
ncbi:Plesd1 [Symbiodinium pilosum]|uniref:Plesd1 protein n=1 Tax=Symbiodinium pilosum TaxID=2952 RepID=A0A812PDC4_SYMPI|nr:Plesd1 [Symbiodinium pilosum]